MGQMYQIEKYMGQIDQIEKYMGQIVQIEKYMGQIDSTKNIRKLLHFSYVLISLTSYTILVMFLH